jgi:glycosyltransferase involved in cell wall biosynthesis
VIDRGARPERVGVFANTVDVEAFARDAEVARGNRTAIRARLGIPPDAAAVLSVARLAPEKGLDTLIGAVAQAALAQTTRLHLLLAGIGPERARLETAAATLGVATTFLGVVPRDRLIETYVAADVFALLSRHEPWGVVVNEAAACGLPLVLSDCVGAGPDLLFEGRNGAIVPAEDVSAAAAAIAGLAADGAGRASAGARSRQVAAAWGYGPSVDGFVEAVLRAGGR